MHNYSNSGYLIKASDLTKHLPVNLQPEYTALLEDADWSAVEDFIDKNMPTQFPKPESVFLFGGDDESEDLEKGEMYVYFNEDDLFTKVPTKGMEVMTAKDIKPVFRQWVTWG